MFSIDLFLTKYGSSVTYQGSLEFAQKHKEQLLRVIRIDFFGMGYDTGQVLGDHIFYLIFTDSKMLGRLFILGCDVKSGYSGSGSANFKTWMDWLTTNKVDISYYSVNSYEEHCQLWGTELGKHGQSLPFANGAHRSYGPSPWSYGDEFIHKSNAISLEEYLELGRDFNGTKQQLYSNTLEFLLGALDSGSILKFL